MGEPTTVRPPGPFLPHGDEPEGVIDLGIRMREHLLHAAVFSQSVRQILAERLGGVARAGRLAMAPGLAEALLHTWPLAHQIDGAREAWRQGPDPQALAVLVRACHVISMALGWPDTVDRVWPMPDPDWILGQTGEGEFRVVPRGPRDGAPAVASVLDAWLVDADPVTLPPVAVVQGDELASRLDELLAQASAGKVVAIRVETPVPWDADSQAALKAVQDTMPAQQAFHRYGHAGLICPSAPTYEDTLTDAPKGHVAERPLSLCDALLLPHLDDDGRAGTAGALAWNDGAYAPVLVHPFAVDVLELLDGTLTAVEVATKLSVSEDLMATILEQLAEVGAIGG